MVVEVYDFGYRTTWRKERRTHAFQLPLTTPYNRADVGQDGAQMEVSLESRTAIDVDG